MGNQLPKPRPFAGMKLETFHSAGYHAKIYDTLEWCRNEILRLKGGRNKSKAVTAATEATGGDTFKQAEVTAVTDSYTYTVDIYSSLSTGGDFVGVTADEEDATMKIQDEYLASGEELEVGDVVPVTQISWGGTTYWTCSQHIGML